MTILLWFFMGVYGLVLTVLCAYGAHRYWILYTYWKYRRNQIPEPPLPQTLPPVTIQLPVYNELYVLPRLIQSVCALDYPRQLLEIQVLDDSTDETGRLAQELVKGYREKGFSIHYLHRSSRAGFKAGALAEGLIRASGRFIAVFDADFTLPSDFLRRTLPYFQDPAIGMVQTRWGHLNADYSLLTRLQTVFLDGHFILEHTARHRSGSYFNFNGTGGIWRREAIENCGGWQSDTLTEDLDLSYRAQMMGWKFIFLPNVVCAGELPVDIHSYRSQQYRWAKGSLQVAKKLLGELFKKPVSWEIKLEAFAHLAANLGYAFVVALAILFFPSLLIRQIVHWRIIPYLEVGAFLLTVVSVVSFYGTALKEVYPDWRWRCRDIPILMAFGVGMCVNNSRAVVHALWGVPSSFERTAKFNLLKRGESWKAKIYHNRGFSWGAIEFGLLAYIAGTFLWAFEAHMWTSLPFIAFYLAGFGYIGYLSFNHRWGHVFTKEVPCQTHLSSS